MSDYREVKKNAFDNGILLDYCGSDERYYYNGLYIDLCGLSAEDYINATKFPCCSGGDNGGGDSPITPQPTATTKETLTLLFTYEDNGDGTYTSIVKADPTPKQNVEIEYIIQDEGGDITINGEITPSINPFVYSSKKFNAMYNIVGETQKSIDITNNEYYNEVILKTGDEISYFGFINSTALADIENYDFSSFNSKTINDQLTDIEVILPPFNGDKDPNDMTDEEYEEFANNNSYLITLLVDEAEWDDNSVFIADPTENNITDTFVKIASNIEVNGKKYCCLSKASDYGISYDTLTLMAFVNDNYEPLDIKFKLKIQ